MNEQIKKKCYGKNIIAIVVLELLLLVIILWVDSYWSLPRVLKPYILESEDFILWPWADIPQNKEGLINLQEGAGYSAQLDAADSAGIVKVEFDIQGESHDGVLIIDLFGTDWDPPSSELNIRIPKIKKHMTKYIKYDENHPNDFELRFFMSGEGFANLSNIYVYRCEYKDNYIQLYAVIIMGIIIGIYGCYLINKRFED